MHTFDSIAGLREWLRAAQRPVGLVPTMGGLHAGHLRLIDEARKVSATVVTSIFVNPIQFNQSEDYVRYPRPLAADLELCAAHGVDAVFAPKAGEMYPRPQTVFVEAGEVAESMEGRFRPGHFRGVATVVMKLFQIVAPERAWFGEKDAQQLAVIRRMVEDLNMPVAIVGVPTVREADGLALSTRNQHLNAEERTLAPRLYRALCAGADAIAAGEADAEAVKRAATAVLGEDPRMRLEYLDVADEAEMQPVSRISGPVRLLAALWLGGTRLIDNVGAEINAGPVAPLAGSTTMRVWP